MGASTSSAPAGTSFTEKLVDATITLGTVMFGQTGYNTVKLTGLRVLATIAKGGFPMMDRASVRVCASNPPS